MIPLFALCIGLAQQSQVTVDLPEDVGVFWERVSFEAGPDKSGQSLAVHASTTSRGGIPYLAEVQIVVGGRRLPCPAKLYSDLEFPNLGTMAVRHSSDQLETKGDFRLEFEYGQTPYLEKERRYVEVRVNVHRGKCVSRQFELPQANGGWRDQGTKP